MKRTYLTAPFLALALGVSLPAAAMAQDLIVLQAGPPRSGEILGVSGGNVRLQIGEGGQKVTTSLPLAQVKSVSKEPPAAYDQALKDWQAGNASAAVAKLKPLVETFNGLPTAWARRSSALLADASIETGDIPGAEAALAAFETAYPDAGDLTNLTKAKIAVAKKDFASAKSLLAPIIEQGAQTKLADSAQSVAYGQAFYLMGQIRESEGAYAEALEDYLRTATLFFEDEAAATRAQIRADALIAEKNVVVP